MRRRKRRDRNDGTGWDRLFRDLAYVGCAIAGISIRHLLVDSQPSPTPPTTLDETLWQQELAGIAATVEAEYYEEGFAGTATPAPTDDRPRGRPRWGWRAR
jgi:hypothetical protein